MTSSEYVLIIIKLGCVDIQHLNFTDLNIIEATPWFLGFGQQELAGTVLCPLEKCTSCISEQ